MKSVAICALIAGAQSFKLNREPLLTWAPTEAVGFKKNYFVPNFGEDRDITKTKNSITAAEKQLGHNWTIPEEPKPLPKNYFVPHFGEDPEIMAAKASIA